MIFKVASQTSAPQIIRQLRTISFLITKMSHQIKDNEQYRSHLQAVDLNQTLIGDNLAQHSSLLAQLESKIKNSQKYVNIKSIGQLLDYLSSWFAEYDNNEANYSVLQKVIKIIELEGKLGCLQEFLIPAITYLDDIAAFPLGTNTHYRETYHKIQVIRSSNEQQTRSDYENFRKLMTITNASVLTEVNQTNAFFGVMAFGLSYPRFFIDHKSAQLKNYAFLRKPDVERLLSIWNLPEQGAIGHLKYCQYPSIRVNTLIYIPLDESKYDDADILTPSERTVTVRVISNKAITFWNKQLKKCTICQSSNPDIESLIIHAHGGGFVALSSSTMQNYTRRWSKELDVPVFSIDYRKPPTHTFPEPVLDVYAVYKFVTTQLYKHCNILPKRIIMTGDSAGGNLVMSATALAMKKNLPSPLGFFLAYPASDLRSIYTPSRLSSFTDAILHPSLLLLCLKCYLGENQKQVENDPLASPLLVSQAYVGGNPNDTRWPLTWPKTRMMVGGLDPLLDDSVRLCNRMVGSGIDVRLKIYRQLGHGFLSVETMIKEGERGIVDSIEFLRQLLQSGRNH